MVIEEKSATDRNAALSSRISAMSDAEKEAGVQEFYMRSRATTSPITIPSSSSQSSSAPFPLIDDDMAQL